MQNVDPVGGVIGIAGLILAVAAFVVQSISLRARVMIAAGCLGLALVGIAIVFLASLTGQPDGGTVAQPSSGPVVAGGGATGAPAVGATGVLDVPAADPIPTPTEIRPEIVTGNYRRLNEDNSAYQLDSSSSKLYFQYGWVARTSDGSLTGDDCVVIARLTDSTSGVVVQNEPSNNCSVAGLANSANLPPGSYRLQIEISRQGRSYAATKDFVIRPA